MSRLIPQPRKKVVAAITKAYGFQLEREGGRHEIYARKDVPEVIAVPRHKMISPGVIRTICTIIGVTVSEFRETLRDC